VDSRWWTQIDAFSVVLLTDVTADEIVQALDPLPADAPALVVCPPIAATTVAACVAEILDALERAAVDLFPVWLPAAADLVGSPSAESAVRVAAKSLAAGTEDFGPFLSDLAVSALNGRAGHASVISAQQRAAGLARVIMRSLGRSRAALVLEAPSHQTAHEEQVRAGAARWLAEQGGMAVWLVGAPLRHVDWISEWQVVVQKPDIAQPPPITPSTAPIQLTVQGKPKRGTEATLARALAQATWAGTHIWNSGVDLASIGPLLLPDIRWPEERVIVEIDGAEHRTPAKYSADRRRDVLFLLSGYTIVRFTNEHVESDLPYVLQTIHDVLLMRRNP
jgi:Protein of unknown function (DUF559)